MSVLTSQAFVAILKRDLRLALRRKSEVLTAVFFYVVVAALFPLGIGPELNTLRQIAPGVLWVGALLSSMLALHRLFEADYRDGSLEQMALSPAPMPLLVGAVGIIGSALGFAVRFGTASLGNAQFDFVAGHTCFVFGGWHWCRTDLGCARRWRVVVVVGVAFVHSRVGIWRGRG
jgi:CcmB protein